MDRYEWEARVNMLLNLTEKIDSTHLAPFWDNGWTPELTATHLRMQLLQPVLPAGKY